MLAGLGVTASELPVEVYDNGVRHAFVALPSREDVAALKPDMGALAELDLVGALAFAGSGTSWKMRMFSPVDGMGEDAGHRLGRRPARLPPRPPRARPVG